MTDDVVTCLLDRRFGLIRRLVQQHSYPELPAGFISYTADVSDSTRAGLPRIDPWGFGAAFYDARRAQWAAIGEAMEGYCVSCPPPALRSSTYEQLLREGTQALDPADVVLYSAAQYSDYRFPFVPLTADLAVRWVAGRQLCTGDPILVPASLVYHNYFQVCADVEPPTTAARFAGSAAGPSRTAAERAALEEVIERDSLTLWWQSGAPAVGIDIESDPVITSSLVPQTETGSIDYYLVWLDNIFGIPVVGALLDDKAHGCLTFGSACKADFRTAAMKALTEAIQLRGFSLDILDRQSAIWRSIETGINDGRCFKPYRADRAYTEDFRLDYRDVVGFGHHAQLYLDPRMRPHVEHVMNPIRKVDFSELPMVAEGDPNAVYVARLAARGFPPLSVDVTTSDVRAAGLSVVRIIVPGLYSDSPAAFPCLGGRRLYEEPVELGWAAAPLSEAQLKLVPLPSL